jgi:hypothetical protein
MDGPIMCSLLVLECTYRTSILTKVYISTFAFALKITEEIQNSIS